MEAAVVAVDSTEEAVVVDSTAVVARITAEEGDARVMAEVADVPTGVPAAQLRAHSQDRALMEIAATHMADGLTARTAADLLLERRRVVPALCRHEILATLETLVIAAPETPLRRIVDQPRHQLSLAMQDRPPQVLVRPSLEIAEAG
jgi:hypothetical protein